MDKGKKTAKQNNFLSNLFKTPSEKEDLKVLLKKMPPFQDLDDKDLDQLCLITHDRVYTSNEYIFYQGDPGIALYIILDGEIELISSLDKERSHKVAHYKKGDLFGEMALQEDGKRFASAVSLKESKLLVIFKPDLEEFIDKFPKKGIKILKGISQIFASRLRKLNQEYINLYFNTTKEQEVENGIPD